MSAPAPTRPRARKTTEMGLPSAVVRTAGARSFLSSPEAAELCRRIEFHFADYFPERHYARKRTGFIGIRIVPWRKGRWLTVYGVRADPKGENGLSELQMDWKNPFHDPFIQHVTRQVQIAYRQHMLDTYSPWAGGKIVQESIFDYGSRGKLAAASDEVPSLKHARSVYGMNAKQLKEMKEAKRIENAGWRASNLEYGKPGVVVLIGQEVGETEKSDAKGDVFTVYHFPARHPGEGAADETFDVTASRLVEDLAGIAADWDATPDNPVSVRITKTRQGEYDRYEAVALPRKG